LSDLAPSSAADWVGAIGTILATVVTAIIALAGYWRDIEQRAQSARNAVLLAYGIAERGARQLARSETFLNVLVEGSPIRYGAKSFLASAAWLELMESITELRPQDLPNNWTADSYAHVRTSLRSVNELMRQIADTPLSAESSLTWPDFTIATDSVAREAEILKVHSETLLQPFTPRWLRLMQLNWRLRKLRRG